MRKKGGYLTVYLSLSLSLILSFVLTMVEGARLHTVRMEAECIADIGMNSVLAEFPWGSSGVVLCSGSGEARFITAFPNTNLFFNLTGIPMLVSELQPGCHRLIHAIYGASEGWKEEKPQVVLDGDRVIIQLGQMEKTIVCPSGWLSQ